MKPRAYLICTTPRAGSTMLCDLLTQTGVAGAPEGYFRPLSIARFCAQFGLPPQGNETYDDTYIRAAIEAAQGAGDIAGFRANWNAMATLQSRFGTYHPDAKDDRARIEAVLGPTAFLHLDRTDKVAQAVSRSKAEQSGLWHRNADGSVREQDGTPQHPTYDKNDIAGFLEEVTHDNAAWENWFQTNGIKPLRICYEAICADPIAEIRRILSALGLDPSAAHGITHGTAKLADEQSKLWAEQFRTTWKQPQ